MKKYEILMSSDKNLNTALNKMQEKVGKYIKEGWELYGELSIVIDSSTASVNNVAAKIYYVIRELTREESEEAED